MTTHNYDPKLNIVLVGGFLISGFSESDMIEVDRKEDRFDLKTGCDGSDSTFVKNNNEQATIKLSLFENSESVNIIDGLVAVANLTGVPIPISIVNANSGRSQFAGECMLQKEPAEKLGKDLPTLEYTFITPKVKTN